MTKPTPTEEQREAARLFFASRGSGDGVSPFTVATLLAEREAPLREAHQRACETVAAMHAAAVGSVRGPIVGVVEDVVALRERAEKAEAAFAAAIDREAKTERWGNQARRDADTYAREAIALRKANERAQAAIAKALGSKEWLPLADLAADVTDLGDALASARAEVARVTAERDEANTYAAEAVARAKTAERRNQAVAENTTRMLSEHKAALAASRAEVEALRAALDDVHTIAVNTGFEEGSRLMNILSNALSSTPAPFHVDAADEATVDALVKERAPRSRSLLRVWSIRPASAEPATPFTDEGSNGFVERAGKGSTKPATPTASLKKGDRVVWSETGEPGVVVEVQPGESPTVVVDFGPGWFSRRISVDMLSLATPTTEGGAK